MRTYIDKVVSEVSDKTHIKDKRLVQLYSLLILIKGPNITLEDVHDAWSMNMNYKQRTDYCYGHDHKSLIPFNELTKDVQIKDQKYVNILNDIAKTIKY